MTGIVSAASLVSEARAVADKGRDAVAAVIARHDWAGRLAKVLRNIWTDGYLVGHLSAGAVLSHHLTAELKADAPTVTLGTDWGGWNPGDTAAAKQILGADDALGRLMSMLDTGDDMADSIVVSRMDRLAGVLINGLEQGLAPATIAAQLNGVLGDAKWAHMVALTETNRAMSAATLDRYKANGVPAKEWASAGDQHVCTNICEVNDEQGAIPVDDPFESSDYAPPGHPLCRCSLYPAWLTVQEAAALGAGPSDLISEIAAMQSARVAEIAAAQHAAVEELAAGVHARAGEILPPVGPARAVPGEGAAAAGAVPKAHGVEVRAMLTQANDAAGVSRAFEAEALRITGQRIPADFVGDVQTAREHAEGVLRGLERFPEADLRGVETATFADASSYAEAEDGIIRFSTDYTAQGARDDYLAALAKDERNHWLADGTASPTGVALHEFGHVVDIETVGEVGHGEITALVDAAAARDGVDNTALIRFDVSRYADEGGTRELAAEAFGQVLALGDAAPQLSRDIYDVLRRDYVAGGREIRPTGPTLARVTGGPDLTGARGLSTDPAVREVQVENRIREAYRQTPQMAGGGVRLDDLRNALGESTNRLEIDSALQRMGRERGTSLLPNENRKEFTLSPRGAALRDAAVRIGPVDYHYLIIENPALRPLPKAIPVKAAPTAKAPAAPKPPTLAALRKVVTDAGITVPTGAPRAVVEDLAAALQRGVEPAAAREAAVRAMVDLRRMVGAKLADVSAALENGASERAMAFHARGLRRVSEPAAPGMGGLGRAVPELGKPLEPLIAALERGDATGAKDALAKAVTGSKLKALGEAGATVSRSTLGTELDWVGNARGDVVHVMQPGYTSTIEGRTLVVAKPSVQAATAERAAEFQAAQPVKRTPAAKTTEPKAEPAAKATPATVSRRVDELKPGDQIYVRERRSDGEIIPAATGGQRVTIVSVGQEEQYHHAWTIRAVDEHGNDVIVTSTAIQTLGAPGYLTYFDKVRVASKAEPAKATPAKAAKAAPAKKAPAPKPLPAPEKMSLPALKTEAQAAIDRANGLRLNQTSLDLALVPKQALASFVTRARGMTDQQLLEEVGRLRQLTINVRRSVADMLSQADQLVADGADAATLAARGAIMVRQLGADGWPDAAAAQKVADAMATGDKKAIYRAIGAAEKKLGLTQVGEDAGTVTTYDRASMKPIGEPIPDGAHVVVVRPGYQLPDGTVLSKPVVEVATQEEVRAAQPRPAMTAAVTRLTGAKGLSADPAVREVQVENRIRQAYNELPKAPGGYVGLADLREHPLLRDLPREEVDAALVRGGTSGMQMAAFDNRRALTARDRAAAVDLGQGVTREILTYRVAGQTPGAAPMRPLPKAAPAKVAGIRRKVQP